MVDKKKIEEFMTYDLMSFKSKNHRLFNEQEILDVLNRYNAVRYEVPGIYKQSEIPAGRINLNYYDILKASYSNIDKILRVDPNCISVCGGAILNSLIGNRTANYGNDIDIFFHNCTESKADELLQAVLKICRTNHFRYFCRSRYCITVQTQSKYQFILRLYEREDHILGGFDLWAARVGYNFSRGLFATAHGLFSILTRSQPVDLSKRSTTYEARLDKYHNDKKLAILFPGFVDNFTSETNIQLAVPWRICCNPYNNKLCLEFHVIPKYKTQSTQSDEQTEKTKSDYAGPSLDKMMGRTYFSTPQSVMGAIAKINSPDVDDIFIFQGRNNNGNINININITDECIRYSIGKAMNYNPNQYDKQKEKWLYNREIKNIKGFSVNTIDRLFAFNPELLQQFKMACYITNNVDEMLHAWYQMQEYYLELGRMVARRWDNSRWLKVNPGRQGYGSFNPIITDPRNWYGPNYDPVNAGVHPTIWKTVQLCRRDNPYWRALPKDVFRIIMNLIIQIECPF